MKRVAEIIYIVESEREAFLEGAIHPDAETEKVLWLCGVRKQQYFALNELIFMTFEYKGTDFADDMAKMASYLDSRGHLVKKRRKDVPASEREATNWWAPVRKIGSILDSAPLSLEEDDRSQAAYMAMLDGGMNYSEETNNISYDDDDWTEGMHI